MWLFAGGIILGAIASLIADRTYRRFERRRETRVRVRIRAGTFLSVGGMEGITFTVSNLATVALPPYQIILYHPGRGSLSMFDRGSDKALLPDQDREHKLELVRS